MSRDLNYLSRDLTEPDIKFIAYKRALFSAVNGSSTLLEHMLPGCWQGDMYPGLHSQGGL